MITLNFPVPDEEKILLGGEGEKNFVRLEGACRVKVLTRNPGITVLASDPEAGNRALEMLRSLQRAHRGGHQLTDFYVEEILQLTSKDSIPAAPEAAKADDFAPHLEKPVLIDRFGNPVQPKTRGQARFIQIVKQNDIVLAAGPAGSGKTFLAVALAVAALEKKIIERIVLVRPAVDSGESLGFLPGVISEKIAPYMRPLYDSLSVMLTSDKLREHWDSNAIEIAPLAYMRGRTLSNSFIILDEAQNTTISQMKMFLTRIGVNSKAVLTGDETQVDLDRNDKSGFAHARKILSGIEGIGQIELTVTDVVRHRLVRDIINAYERSGFSS